MKFFRAFLCLVSFAVMIAEVSAEDDTTPPIVVAPEDVSVIAQGLFTTVSLGVASAVDDVDGPLSAVANPAGPFAPGRHLVTWTATDSSGNVGSDVQTVDVKPLASIGPDKSVAAGQASTIDIFLNGSAPAYPLQVPFELGGTAQAGIHYETPSTQAVFEAGTSQSIPLTTLPMAPGSDSVSLTVTLTLPSEEALYGLGANASATITLVAGNLPPTVELSVFQRGVATLSVHKNLGISEVEAHASDVNGDELAFDWSASDSELLSAASFVDDRTLLFDPQQLLVGEYHARVTVSDGAASDSAQISFNVSECVPELDDFLDADCDGIDNSVDPDDDNDGFDDELDFAPLDDEVGGLGYDVDSPYAPGTEENPYLVATLTDLAGLGVARGYWAPGVYLRLIADIDASETASWNGGAGFVPIGEPYVATFSGQFDGAGHAITGLTIGGGGVGLFAELASSSVVTDLTLAAAEVSGGYATGVLAGVGYGTVRGLRVSGVVAGVGSYSGGLFGLNFGSVSQSVFSGEVSGGSFVGGLAGENNGEIVSSYVEGTVSGTVVVGGLVGRNQAPGVVQSSYALASVVGSGFGVGGIAGENFYGGTITASYAVGPVSGESEVGGLVGYNDQYSVLASSYWASGEGVPLEGIGVDDSDPAQSPTSLTPVEMQLEESFVGFDFVGDPLSEPVTPPDWVIVEGYTRPYLWWQDDDADGVPAWLDDDDDGDGTNDSADAFPLDASEALDTDTDRVGDNADNCPADSNADQLDTDGDTLGDACDPDDDNDGFDDLVDNCRLLENDQSDLDKDGAGDECDDDDDNDGYSDTVEIARGSDPRDAASIPPRAGLPTGVLQLLLED